MTVFVAGGSGSIGIPLVRALVAAGHRVVATTRKQEKQSMLRGVGATPVVVDVFDSASLDRAVQSAGPTHVIHQLTALPKLGPRRAGALEPTNRLREEGTRNLLHAAIAAGAKRIIAGSFAPLAAISDISDSDPLFHAVQALRSMESQLLDAARLGAIEGIVLRYGLFYGPGNPATDEMASLVRKRWLPRLRNDPGELPYIHIDDAVSATVAALNRGISGSVYEIVDDHSTSFSDMVTTMAEIAAAPRPRTIPKWVLRLASPYMSRILTMRVPLSNIKAKKELGWKLMFPSYHEGLRQTLQKAG